MYIICIEFVYATPMQPTHSTGHSVSFRLTAARLAFCTTDNNIFAGFKRILSSNTVQPKDTNSAKKFKFKKTSYLALY